MLRSICSKQAAQLDMQMLRAGSIDKNVRKIDVYFQRQGERHPGLRRRLSDTHEGYRVQITSDVTFEFGHDPVRDPLVDAIAKLRVAAGWFYFQNI
jgi:hypothetical protein